MKPIDFFDAEEFLYQQPFDVATALGHCNAIDRFMESRSGEFLQSAL